MKIASALIALIMLITLPVTANAEDHRICLVYENLNIWDASARFLGDDAGEDHGRRTAIDDSEELLQFVPDHMLVRVSDGNMNLLWGWRPVGSDGCTGVFDAAGAVRIDWINWSYWPETDNGIATGRCDASECQVRRYADMMELPPGQHDVVFAFEPRPEDAILWAASNVEGRASFNRGVTTFGVYWSGSDPTLDSFPGAYTNAMVGGSPTMAFKGTQLVRSKYTMSHEYGHAVTLASVLSQFSPGQVDFCFDPNPNDDPPSYSCAQHTWDSAEWQSAAILEGFAQFYSYAAWNDLPYEGYRGMPMSWAAYGDIVATTDSPDSFYVSNFCSGVQHCQPGVANERDWAYFLWDIVQADVLSLSETMDLLEGFHPNWPAADSPTDATWQTFRAHVEPMLTPAELATWDDLAQLRGIDN